MHEPKPQCPIQQRLAELGLLEHVHEPPFEPPQVPADLVDHARDAADVDVGTNIGAILQADQAEADLKVARAKAEERRAAAVALEQEMRAKVVEAEAEIPQAMAEAFRSGNMGIMDYYNLKNIQSDTDMRKSIADTDKDKDQKN